MELPFYLNFKDFENHYYDNLEKWFEEYYNTSETDYLKALADLYSPYLYYNFVEDKLKADAFIEIKDCFFPYHDKIGISFCSHCEKGETSPKALNQVFEFKNISMMEYAQHILDKINKYCSKNQDALNGNKNILDYINDHNIVTSMDGVGYCISYNRHQKVIPFLKAYLPYYGQTVNMAMYRDFIFSIADIAEYIDQKLKAMHAFEHSIYSQSKAEAKFKVQMSRQFLTLCN
ncbi:MULTISPECIES: hypothetical protein [unclassified Chryseobacterium]|uniref:hypothetical protein n=1 Tax=unclassified Chryseobacterium TaxID=2593645 RepID=UPI000F45AABD|nr:hypothetical protein [Chryseobacterium sp. G0240]ROI01894.1 hypothetical protein EGI16_16485 [Chryseobacterium sp. G0240]